MDLKETKNTENLRRHVQFAVLNLGFPMKLANENIVVKHVNGWLIGLSRGLGKNVIVKNC